MSLDLFSATARSGPDNVSTDILRPEKSPNQLVVDDGVIDDNSVAALNANTMEALQLFRGDTIIVRGKERKDTVLICLSDEEVDEGKIRMNQVARNNIRVQIGDFCNVQPCLDIKYGRRVYILPFDDSVKGLGGDVFEDYLKPYFDEAYRPICKGDTFVVNKGARQVEFEVIETDPADFCIVAPDTVIGTDGDPVKRKDKERNLDEGVMHKPPQDSPPLSRSASTPMIPSTLVPDPRVSSLMSTAEVIDLLGNHGCQDITDRLDLLACSSRPIATGGFGDVYHGKLLDGSQVAIKTMRILINTDEAQKPLKNAARELHTWSKCQHPNVLRLLGLVEFRDQIGMVSDWMENGSLSSYLNRHPKADRCWLSAKICEGLAYLHAANIVHGDLKGLNVLISGNGTPMLTDFGNAVLQESTLQFTATTAKTSLSPRWAAPELIEGAGMHSFAADVYALGMTILETVTGKLPYANKSDHGVYFAVAIKKEPPLRPEDLIPSNTEGGDKLWSLLTSCWVYEPQSRPSAEHVRDVMRTINQEELKIV